ncbi:MAG: TRAP transporter small permease [Desulfobulbaceae bacterium]|nr:TRAP transporter small permease [Desulfobulbaceae bacterium]
MIESIFVTIEKTSDFFDKLLRYISSYLLSIMVIAVFIGVLNRFVFQFSFISWTEELARFLLIYICMIGSCIAIKNGGHVNIVFIIERLKQFKKPVVIFNHLIVIIFLSVVTIYGTKLCFSQSYQLSPALRISMSIPFASVPFGCFVMVIHSLALIAKALRQEQELNINDVEEKNET